MTARASLEMYSFAELGSSRLVNNMMPKRGRLFLFFSPVFSSFAESMEMRNLTLKQTNANNGIPGRRKTQHRDRACTADLAVVVATQTGM